MAVELLDYFWENGVLGLIGATIDPANYVPSFRVVDRTAQGGNCPTLFSVELTILTTETEVVDSIKKRWAETLGDGIARKVCQPKVEQLKLVSV